MNPMKKTVLFSLFLSAVPLAWASQDVSELEKEIKERNDTELPAFIASIEKYQPIYQVRQTPTSDRTVVTSATIKFDNDYERTIAVQENKNGATAKVTDISNTGVPSTRRYEGDQAKELGDALRQHGRKRD